jgi:hypothetical protein
MIEFEWDDVKAAANLRKHGVSFAFAAKAFRDPSGIEWIDDREDYGEVRTILLGMADGTIRVAFVDGTRDTYPPDLGTQGNKE